MTAGNILFMMASDMKDAFVSVSHKQLLNILKNLGLFKPIRQLIMEGYTGVRVKIIILDGHTNNITIKRWMKQGCGSVQS
jgi:hypothetical protein